MPCSASASRGEIHIEFDRLPPVMGERLVGRRERQEEMGVEALRQEGRGDPMGEGREKVDRRDERLSGQELGERARRGRAFPPGRRDAISTSPRGRASSTPHSSNASRIAATLNGASGSALRPIDAASSASAGSIRPPGKTSAPEAKSI